MYSLKMQMIAEVLEKYSVILYAHDTVLVEENSQDLQVELNIFKEFNAFNEYCKK